ncbi:MAG: glutathione-regulated potassium-efflux system ancillary protein KefC [Candidatus Azotimanducaceae bacterium]
MDALVILLAFLLGLGFKKIGYPPLPGYLIAGFVAHGLGFGDVDLISDIADLGILLLLFTIGLKLNIREIAATQIWAVAALQIAISVPLTVVVILLAGATFPILALENTTSAWMLALSLSFSSTVFAVKVFEERGETNSYHARLAIGVLVIQDIIAVVFLVLNSDKVPSIWAFGLLGIFLLRPLLFWLLQQARHSELVLLLGVVLALGAAQLFEVVGLKGGLGALCAGVVLSGHRHSGELHSSLVGLKDLLLIGFFLQIGFYGLPEAHMWFVAIALSCLIFLRPAIYFLLFVGFKLRARTALLAGSGLFNYSEFGLIVAAFSVANGDLPAEWLTTIALALSLSFFIATPLNTRIHEVYRVIGHRLQWFERTTRLPAEEPVDLGSSEIVVLGMGRVGRGVFLRLQEIFGDIVVGVEEDYNKVLSHQEQGVRCVHGDASDFDFWTHAGLREKRLVVISLTNHTENLIVTELALQVGFKGTLAVVSRYPDEQKELEALGCISFNLYQEAGIGFAEHVVERFTDIENSRIQSSSQD